MPVEKLENVGFVIFSCQVKTIVVVLIPATYFDTSSSEFSQINKYCKFDKDNTLE